MKKTLFILSLTVGSALAMETDAPKTPEAKPGICARVGAKADALGSWSADSLKAGWQHSRDFCVNRAGDVKALGTDVYTWGKTEKTKAALYALSLIGVYRGQKDFRAWRSKKAAKAV